MKKKPKISVILPVYNAQKYIGKTIESLLNQTFNDFEIIVVDDCSSDHTIDIIRNYRDARIIIHSNESNKGVAISRNRAIEYSRGEYIAIMDHDDIAESWRLEREFVFLNAHEDYGVVGGKTILIDENDCVIKDANKAYNNSKYIKAIFLFRNVFCNSEMMVRRKVIEENNIKYDDNCYGMEDFKFWIEVSKITKMIMLDEVFLQHRIHNSSITNTIYTKFGQERFKTYGCLQKYSWKLSGLQIPDNIAVIIHKYIGEKNYEGEITKFNIDELYSGLQMFLKQCKKLDYYAEIEHYCKNIMLQYIKRQNDFW